MTVVYTLVLLKKKKYIFYTIFVKVWKISGVILFLNIFQKYLIRLWPIYAFKIDYFETSM